MMKIINSIIAGFMAFASVSAAYAQEISDSIAVCPPGEPAEAIEADRTPGMDSRFMSVEEITVATDTIIANYDSDWTDLSMQGRLQFDGLPMRVNVKVYMKRGESIILSARAPIFGEVARVEVNTDSIVLINKHTRCYNSQSISGLGVDAKAYLCDLQDIMMGQVAFPGHGRLTPEMALDSQWIAMKDDNALIYPYPDLQVAGTEYGFVMDSSCWQLRSFVLMLKRANVAIDTNYKYGQQGWTLGLEINLPKKKMNGEVELSYPDYQPNVLDFTNLDGKYRKVDIKQLLRF
ncbi:MAG: DUF4292 domain-containing protein [Muribaculaceae bacterium]|nr:DUF4292 domain-containing protein [Muribaculaceae bacterium]